jgi:hypothetical protein
MSNKIFFNSVILLFILFFGVRFVSATSVSRLSLVNLEGQAGTTITQEILLEGDSEDERFGFWYNHYKKVEGDSEKMDITSWVTIEPKDYVIKPGETKKFNVIIKIPKNTEPGLWGAVSANAGREGYSDDRRSYIIFKDSLSDGNVYSGLLIPISVQVLESKNSLELLLNLIVQNKWLIILTVIILIMAILLFKKRKR